MAMTRVLSICFFIVSAAFSCAGQKTQSSNGELILPLCELVKEVTALDGKTVRVSGTYRHVFHGSLLTSPACPHEIINVRILSKVTSDKQNWKRLGKLTDRGKDAEVVVEGMFEVAHKGECFGADCAPYQVEVRKLVSVQIASVVENR